jgi:hypothetical protein
VSELLEVPPDLKGFGGVDKADDFAEWRLSATFVQKQTFGRCPIADIDEPAAQFILRE